MFAAISLLFVPGSRADRFAKAQACGEGLVVIDLEDSVAAGDKRQARDAALAASRDGAYAIRMNAVTTLAGLEDIVALERSAARPAALFVPMVEAPAEIAIVRKVLGDRCPPLVPLIETPAGLAAAAAIGMQPGVAALMFGGGDLSAELGVALEWEPLLAARGGFLLACAQARVPAIDVPFIDLDDSVGLANECAMSRRIGFAAKAAIHPAQVPVIEAAFRPDAAEIEEAEAALAAYAEAGERAVRFRGRMLEAPMVKRYQAVLARGGERDA